MGFFKDLFKQEPEPPTISKGDILKEKLKGMGIDFDSYWFVGGEDLELSIDDEVLGTIRKSYNNKLEREGERFSSCISSENKNGRKSVFLIKNNITERDIKNFIDEITNVLGSDWLCRTGLEFRDLSVIRGEKVDNDTESLYENGVLREWFEISSDNYRVRFAFDKDEDGLNISLYMFFK